MSDHSVIFKFISVILLITNKRCRCLSIQIPNQQHQENQFFPTSGSFKFLMLQRCRRGLLTSEETPIISNLLPLHPVYFYLSCFFVYLFLSTSISDRWICQTKTDNGYYFIPIIITHKTGIIGIYGYCIILRKSSCLTFSILHQTCPGSRLQSHPPPLFLTVYPYCYRFPWLRIASPIFSPGSWLNTLYRQIKALSIIQRVCKSSSCWNLSYLARPTET